MIPAQAALVRAARRLVARLDELEPRLAGDGGAWTDYLATIAALVGVTSALSPAVIGRLLTTAEMASALNVSPKTLLRKRKAGQLQAVQLGQRGRAALRWRGDEVTR